MQRRQPGRATALQAHLAQAALLRLVLPTQALVHADLMRGLWGGCKERREGRRQGLMPATRLKMGSGRAAGGPPGIHNACKDLPLCRGMLPVCMPARNLFQEVIVAATAQEIGR